MRTTKRKLSELSVGNNVIIPIPQNFKNWRSGLSELQVQRWLQNFIPKELLPQLETDEDLEQILVDAGEGDITDGTTDDDESAISTDISEVSNRKFT
jgi:hypothetical protein